MTKFESRSLPLFELFGPEALTDEQEPDLHHAGSAPAVEPGPATLGGEPRFHSVGEQESAVAAVLDERGRFVFVSPAAEQLFGYDTRDVVGLDAFSLFDSSSVDHVRSLFDDLVAGRRLSVSLEMQTVRADGRTIDLDVMAANHLHDPVGGVVVTVRDTSDSRRLEEAMLDVDRRQATIIESLTDGVMIVDSSGTVVRVNVAFEVMFESPRVRLLGRHLRDLLAGGRALGLELVDADGHDIDLRDHPIAASLRGGRRSVGVVLGLRRTGHAPMWVRANAQAMVDRDGAVTGAVASFSDITATRRAAAELRRGERFLQVLLDTLDEGIVACDAEGRITVFNPSARRLHGLPEGAEPIGEIPADEGLRHTDGSPIAPRENPLIRAMSGEQVREAEIVLESDTGDGRKVRVNSQALVDDEGRLLGAVAAMHDVTEQKRNEERLAEMALHDPLTGLANRTLLAERLQAAIDRMVEGMSNSAGPAGGEPAGLRGTGDQPGVAVFLLDLDEFKEVNDQLGHDVGDDLLIAVARRLAAIVRPSDTVARLGGDEFVVVCDIESGEDEMLRITDRISTVLARPYRVAGRTMSVLASVGGVFVDNPDTDPSKLLSRADDAMYGVKWTRRRQRRSARTDRLAAEWERGGTDSLRVALVCPYSLSRPGGVQGQVVGLAHALERRAHRATVFAPMEAASDAPSGIEVVPTGRPVSLPANGSVAPVAISMSAAVRARRALRAGRFDVVHVHEPFAPGLPYALLVDRRLPPVVATFHRSGGSVLYRILRPLTSRLGRRLDLRCAVSEAALATAAEALGGTFELCFNGVDVGCFEGVEPWPTERPAVLFLGRHEERKGLGVLLEAFDRLRAGAAAGADGGPEPELWVAGDGPETAPLRRRHPDSADVRWLGVLSEEEKLRRLVAARVLCAPSLGGESFGMVLLEAMAARTVVVASDIPGYRDAAGGHAVLTPPGDSDALAEAMARLVMPGSMVGGGGDPGAPGRGGGPEAGEARLDAPSAWAAHWSMERLAEWYEGRYRAVVAGPPG